MGVLAFCVSPVSLVCGVVAFGRFLRLCACFLRLWGFSRFLLFLLFGSGVVPFVGFFVFLGFSHFSGLCKFSRFLFLSFAGGVLAFAGFLVFLAFVGVFMFLAVYGGSRGSWVLAFLRFVGVLAFPVSWVSCFLRFMGVIAFQLLPRAALAPPTIVIT